MIALREARERIDPDLLEKAREMIKKVQTPSPAPGQGSSKVDSEPVDQKKTLAVALRFLELQPHNKALKDVVTSFLKGQ